MRAQKDDRQFAAALHQSLLKFETVESRHLQIEQETPGRFGVVSGEKFSGEANTATSIRTERSKRETALRTAVSSSTTKTVGSGKWQVAGDIGE